MQMHDSPGWIIGFFTVFGSGSGECVVVVVISRRWLGLGSGSFAVVNNGVVEVVCLCNFILFRLRRAYGKFEGRCEGAPVSVSTIRCLWP